ncbi:unnamed protein product [marine sediment metagenome]|uniref:Uncharacterized protein n=1 Tax=marine sediment metagenome TaxID=412755 RepID=X1SH01_9ZZZZ
MDIASIEVGQELVYLSIGPGGRYGPRIRVTRIDGRRVIGTVLDPMQNPWPVGSSFSGLPLSFRLPEDVPA